MPTPKYLALDLTYTHSDPRKGSLLELAYIALDEKLNELGHHTTTIGLDDTAIQRQTPDVELARLLRIKVLDTIAATNGVAYRVVGNPSSPAVEEKTLIDTCRAFPEPPILIASDLVLVRQWIATQLRGAVPWLRLGGIDAGSLPLLFPGNAWPAEPEGRSLDLARHAVERVRYARKWVAV